MHCRFLPFVRRALGALALAWSLCAARGVQAGNILETTGVDLNEPLDPFDDQTVLVRQRWSDQALPVRFYLYRQPDMIGGSVMNPAFYSIDLDNFIWPTDIQRQLQQTLQSWTGCSFSHFSFDPTLNYADQLKPFTDPPTLNPVDRAQLDGYNLITFQEPVVVLPTGITSETSLFILTTGFDVEGLQNRFPSAILGRTENNATIIDINQDGNADLILTRDSYNDGEIIDADIIFDSTEPNYVLWPEDIHDVTVPLDQILGTLDIQALTAHELGHAQGLAHSQLATPILFESVTEVNLLPGGAFSFNPYAKREPKYDDFVSQALQYPGGQPSNRGAFGGQVLNGDFLDLFFVGTPPRTPAEPTDPFVLQTPVYLCQQATSNESHPDNTDYLWMEQPNRHFDQGSGQTAVYDENTSGGLPITFRRVASVPTGLDLRINIGGNAGPHTPPEVLDSSYFIPGVPIRDDYALYIDDARMTNVNDVLSNIEGLNSLPANPGVSHPPSSVNYAFPPEYYGGANAPAFGSGSGTLPYSIEYTVDSQTRVSVGVPGQGNVGLPLTSGHDNPEKNFALIEVDGHRFDTRQEFPGQIITPIFTNFLGTAVGVFRIDDKAKLGFQVGFTTAGGLREEGPVLPMD
ncbi:MAG: hypothetical protein NTW86_08100, partial [Candidatus Sumerlaeota bacterium]|nr:hypothetical protein [Candidatus Sumerlaeota bacterium]